MEILGIAVSAVIAAPNLLLLTATPQDLPPKRQVARWSTYHVMEIVERVGQIATFVVPLWFKLPLDTPPQWALAGVMLAAATFYYTCWIRFVRSGSRYRMLFAPMFGVPIPMAVAPIAYFAVAAVAMGSWLLGASVTVMAAGHLYVSWSTWRYLESLPAGEAVEPTEADLDPRD